MQVQPTVLVTGATGNIGGGAATALAQRGARVVLLGRRPVTLESRADATRQSSGVRNGRAGTVETLVIDFEDLQSVRAAARTLLERYPAISGLLLSVGRLVQRGPHVLPNGHEAMFATSVIGPFLLTHLLLDRLEQSGGIVLQVIAPFRATMDWSDLESIRNHRTATAYNRAKTCERMLSGEFARRYAGRVSFVAFDPGFIIDKADPELRKRWPRGPMGLFWRGLAAVAAGPPSVAGEPIAEIMLAEQDRASMNGRLVKLRRIAEKPDQAMSDRAAAARLWQELSAMVGLAESAR